MGRRSAGRTTSRCLSSRCLSRSRPNGPCRKNPRADGAMVSGLSWGLALWVSLYEPAHLVRRVGSLLRRGSWFEPDCTFSSNRLVSSPRPGFAGCARGAALAGLAGRTAIFRKLVRDHRRAQICWPNESSLAALVRWPGPSQPAFARLGAATAHPSLDFCRSARPDLFPDSLAGALGLFFCRCLSPDASGCKSLSLGQNG